MKINGHEIDISNRDKVFFPDAGVTKGDIIDYYGEIANVMVPHLERYGVSMQRMPDGLNGPGFYNKDVPEHFPDWIKTFKFPKQEGGSFRAPVIDSRAALIYMADQAVLTPHVYLAPYTSLRNPDKMIYDLDPPEGTEDFHGVRSAALDVKKTLEEIDLISWVQTTGSKGYHVVVPLDGSATFDEVRDFARKVALLMVRRNQDEYTLEERKNKRKGRIFLDMLRNSYGATAVAPYSVRARKGATIATPIDWDEVSEGASPRDWSIKNIMSRMGHKNDPWSDMMRHARKLTAHRDKLDELLENERPADEEQS
jgi:bifunctional non-homologous end joining protein LigD